MNWKIRYNSCATHYSLSEENQVEFLRKTWGPMEGFAVAGNKVDRKGKICKKFTLKIN